MPPIRTDKKKAIIKAHVFALMVPLCVVASFGLVMQVFAQEAPIPLTPADTPAPAAKAKTSAIPVTITTQNGTSRIIFDLPALTPYVAHKKGNGAEFVFRTGGSLGQPKGSSAAIENLAVGTSDDGSAVATLSLKPGSSYKHYRLQKKVIIDIVGAQKEKPATPDKQAEKPKEEKPATVAKPVEKPTAKETAIAAATSADEKKPVPQAAVTKIPAAAETPAPAVDGPAIAAAPVTPVTTDTTNVADEADHAPTHLKLETLEPVKIAVFTRFDTLWFVIDSISDNIQPPAISGPLAQALGKPRMTTFTGGTAFRYNMPEHSYITARKENMGWDVNLTAAPLQAPSDLQANVEFDNQKAKIVLPVKGSGKVLEITDPDIGDKISVIAASLPTTRVDQARHFTNLDIIPAAIGVAMKPLSDDVRVNRIEDFVLITSPDGIIATPPSISGPSLTMPTMTADSNTPSAPVRRLFDFPNWRQGGPTRLYQNVATLQNQIAKTESPEVRNELLMKMALLYFANNMGQETLGVLRILEQDNPDLFNNPSIIALRGVSSAMANHYTEALSDLSNPDLQQNPEARLWIGTAAAATEQWQMANREFPKDNSLLVSYPENIAVPITIYMAESALRLGRTADAQTLLDTLKMMPSATDIHHGSAIGYLRGEIARQEGRNDDAVRIWKDVSIGIDRLYHTKASLALANLQLQLKQITPQAAIDQVDSLRFAWRGDGLEVQIMHNLGVMKTQAGKYLEGMQDLKSTVTLADSMMLDTDPIKADIVHAFNEVFSGSENAKKISAIEAVSVYNEFQNLVPAGEAGTDIRLRAADFMISIDLMSKAATILEDLLANGMIPADKIASTGAKLAAVYLLDDRNDSAISALEKTASSAMDDAEKEKRALLMARAQSQMGNTDQSIQTLSDYYSTDAQKLKVDILWRARRWGEAAEILLSILPDAAQKNLTDDDAQMIVNAAVACKLANNTACLQNMKSTYAAAMAGNRMATTFTVITRDGGAATLADRETILRIAGEADLFKQFLDGYKSSATATAATPAPDAPAAATTPAEKTTAAEKTPAEH